MASVKQLNPNKIEVTSQRNGRIVGVSQLPVAPGGASNHASYENKEDNTTKSYEMQKQP
jgi:hypothetical protein